MIIQRKIREETGVGVVIKNIMGIYNSPGPNGTNIYQIVYLGIKTSDNDLKGSIDLNSDKITNPFESVKQSINEVSALTYEEIRRINSRELHSHSATLDAIKGYIQGKSYPLEIIKFSPRMYSIYDKDSLID